MKKESAASMKVSWEDYAENMNRLVRGIIHLFTVEPREETLTKVWILSSTLDPGSFTLTCMGKNNEELLNTLKAIAINCNIKEKNLKCLDTGGINELYDSILKELKKEGEKNSEIESKINFAKTQSIKLISDFTSAGIKPNFIDERPVISVWVSEKEKKKNHKRYLEAIFYLTETEQVPMKFRAFYVHDEKMAEFLIEFFNNAYKKANK